MGAAGSGEPTHVLTVRRTDGAAFGLFGQTEERVAVYGEADLDRRIQAAEQDGGWECSAEELP